MLAGALSHTGSNLLLTVFKHPAIPFSSFSPVKLRLCKPELRECSSHDLRLSIGKPELRSALRAQPLYLKVASFESELWKALSVLLAFFTHANFEPELRDRVLRLCLEVAMLQLELRKRTSHSAFEIKSCDFLAKAAADQAGGTRDCAQL